MPDIQSFMPLSQKLDEMQTAPLIHLLNTYAHNVKTQIETMESQVENLNQ